LDWHLTQYPEHHHVQQVIADLNETYKDHAPLWQQDISRAGFQWLIVDDGAANIVAFARFDTAGNPLISLTNFSPVPHQSYKLPLPGQHQWRVLLNTDDLKYGGSGITPTEIPTYNSEYKGFSTHTVLSVPPLATVWLVPVTNSSPR